MPDLLVPWLAWAAGLGLLVVLLGLAVWWLARRPRPVYLPEPVNPWNRAFTKLAGIRDDLAPDRKAAIAAAALRRLLAQTGRSPWPAFTAREVGALPLPAKDGPLIGLLAACERLASQPDPDPAEWRDLRDHCLRCLHDNPGRRDATADDRATRPTAGPARTPLQAP